MLAQTTYRMVWGSRYKQNICIHVTGEIHQKRKKLLLLASTSAGCPAELCNTCFLLESKTHLGVLKSAFGWFWISQKMISTKALSVTPGRFLATKQYWRNQQTPTPQSEGRPKSRRLTLSRSQKSNVTTSSAVGSGNPLSLSDGWQV